VAHRPTPRHGWTTARDATDEAQEPDKDSAVLRVSRSKVDSTISLVGLDAGAERKPDETRDYAESGVAPSAKRISGARGEPVAKQIPSTIARDKTIAGLPPVSGMFRQTLAKATEDEPADALPWKPSAPTPGLFKRDSLSPAGAARDNETTRDLSVADLSFADTPAATHGDRTEVDTIDELSLSGAEANESAADASDDATPEAPASTARHTAREQVATDRPPSPSSPRGVPRAAWLLVATCGLTAIGWAVLPSTITHDARDTMRPASVDVLAARPKAASSSLETALPQLPGAAVAGDDVRPSPGPDTNANSPAAPDEEADEEERESDVAHTGTAVRARELVEQGRALHKRKKYAQAEERYREALEVHPGYPRALKGLVRVAMAQGKGKQAISLAKQLQRARSGQVAYLVLLGDAYESAGKRKEARQAWQAAARKGSSTARARLKR
jgi:hypothetical protein